jgi:hypothetical protein
VTASWWPATATLDLTIDSSGQRMSSTDQVVACNSYTWIDGVTYSASTTSPQVTLTAANGCDSIVSLDLTIDSSLSSTDQVVACNSYTWIDGVTYSASTTSPQVTLTAANGCDSIVSLDLTIDSSVSSTDQVVACNSYTWIDGVTYSASTTSPQVTLTAANGCDSIVSLDLTIDSSVSSTDQVVACNSYTWIDGVTYSASTTSPQVTLTAANGCDSIVSLDLTIDSSLSSTDQVVACNSYTWIDGVTYSASTTSPQVTLTAANGCDSIVSLDLTIDSSVSSTDQVVACNSYTWIDGVTYSASTTSPQVTLTAANGCDSIVSLDLTIDSSVSSTDQVVACNSYTWIDGVTYSASTTSPQVTLTAANGCDSIVSLDLTIDSSVSSTDQVVACNSYTWIDGVTYSASTTSPQVTLTAANGCDSIVSLDLTIDSSVSSTDQVVACNSYTWIDGVTYSASTTSPQVTLTAANGCDSIVSLDLTIDSSVSSTDQVVACNSYTWIDGVTYSASTTSPQVTLTAANGCDSIVSLDLTIDSSVSSTDQVVACNSYTWIDGVTYSASTTSPQVTLTAANGCDSIVSLDLTIDSSVSSTDQVVACNSYTWIDGVTYSASTTSPNR